MLMRKLILGMSVSLDGFVARPDGDNSWVFPDFNEEYGAYNLEMLSKVGVHVMGGNLGRAMASYFPHSTEDFAQPMNEIPKVIFSKSIDQLDWQNTRIEHGDVATAIKAMKQEPGEMILAHGGAKFAQSLTALGLVDEYWLGVHPVVLGEGMPIFPKLDAPLRLNLIESRRMGSLVINILRRE